MKRLLLAVVLCCAFVGVSNADECSDFCKACKNTGLSSACCSAYMSCQFTGGGYCKDAKKEDCPQGDWETEDDNRRRQPVFAPDAEQELRRQRGQEWQQPDFPPQPFPGL
ncbi:MAG: hypothetical protein LBH33_02215 [Endomicrobium sp.]|nr:hypothetical protein [Endomicrobium sp.]